MTNGRFRIPKRVAEAPKKFRRGNGLLPRVREERIYFSNLRGEVGGCRNHTTVKEKETL